MLNRREFIKTLLSAGFVLGSGSMINGCSGLKRNDLPDSFETERKEMRLDSSARHILYHASLAPSGHNSQPWRVRIEAPHSWIIEADSQRRLPCVDPQNRELFLSLGAFVENLSLAAGTMGWSADVQVIANDHHDRDAIRVALRKDRPIEYPLWRMYKRRTLKHGFLSKEIAAVDIHALSDQMDGHLFYFPRGSSHATCIRNSAVENYRIQAGRDDAQKELVRWLRLNDQDVRRYRDGLTTEGLEISGFNGWFVRNFVKPENFLKETYRRQGTKLMAEMADQGGGWLVITSHGQTVTDWIETGRRFERMALLAREIGIAIHPMTQVLEEQNGIAQIANHHASRLFPQFVLRVGYLDKFPEPASPRRPPEWFVYA